MTEDEQCKAITYERAVGHDTRCRKPSGHVGRHDDGCLSWEDPPPEGRTCDILLDASDDIRDVWPWVADAILVMREGLTILASRGGPDAHEAQRILEHAERVAQGERDSVEPSLPPNK